MNDYAISTSPKSKNQVILELISLISLIATAVGCLSYFFYYGYEFMSYTVGLHLRFPDFTEFLMILLKTAAVVLLFLYVKVFSKQQNKMVFIAVTCIVLATRWFLALFIESSFYLGWRFILYSGQDILLAAAFTLAAIAIFTNSPKRIIAMAIAVVLGFSFTVLTVSDLFDTLADGRIIFAFTDLSAFIGNAGMFASLIMIETANTSK